jgi:hypothetical protein
MRNVPASFVSLHEVGMTQRRYSFPDETFRSITIRREVSRQDFQTRRLRPGFMSLGRYTSPMPTDAEF